MMRLESARPDTTVPSAAAQQRTTWRTVGIPSEHGGWGLTAEPILLGLLVSFSWLGAAVGTAALLAFLVRTPLKVVLVDRHRKRDLQRTRVARRIAAAELVLIAVLGMAAVSGGGWEWLWPILVALPLISVELWYDARSRSRRLVPELCGAVGISSVAAAIVLIGGGSTTLAVGVWIILAARAFASISFVRAQIFRLRRGEAPLGSTLALQAVGVVLASAAAVGERSLAAGAVAVGVLVVAQLVWLRRPVPPVKVVGITQMVIGFAVVGVTAAGVLVGSA